MKHQHNINKELTMKDQIIRSSIGFGFTKLINYKVCWENETWILHSPPSDLENTLKCFANKLYNHSRNMTTKGKLMQVNIKLMKFLNMWPKTDETEPKYIRMLKDSTGYINVFLGIWTSVVDLAIQVGGQYDDVIDITENCTSAGALIGSMYMGICFIQNRKGIMKLIDDLDIFEEFCSADKMIQTEQKARFVTKLIVIYGIVGNLIYVAVPYTNLGACREKRSHYKYYKMPCELITRFRLPFHYEDKPWAVYCAAFWQLILCVNCTIITISITMFIVAFLVHVIAQLQDLRVVIRENQKPVRDFIRYHIAIIEYASSISDAFSSTMLMYITLTSFQISVLGFEVLMVNSITDSIRFALHLLGWVVLLYLVCSYGQQLKDESMAIAWEAYSIPWYDKSVSEQKDLKLMILRSQRPLVLTAASLGTLSLEVFLSVLSTAYSYFTLLLNFKNDE